MGIKILNENQAYSTCDFILYLSFRASQVYNI